MKTLKSDQDTVALLKTLVSIIEKSVSHQFNVDEPVQSPGEGYEQNTLENAKIPSKQKSLF